ncbi:hypothetical protein ANCDUO_09461 [Ancylostoma duodenale]|uniref:G-protein coupled receptors family 1 profile domain-containing protein n=1 Tax=Ancylostoma duodenale TaxID=51022 RepID=A0A0C2GGK1_9BILA|nr:hypothetical protein ANCDUO_09461 [Ancylostoma duodenale]
MKQSACFYLVVIPLIGAGFGSPLILNLGVDRLIAVLFPSRYRFFQTIPYTYVACHMLLPLSQTIYLLVLAFVNRTNT